MSRTVKTPLVRCSYCGALSPRGACKRSRDGTWRCQRDAGLQSVRGKHRLAHLENTAHERREAAGERR